MKLKKPKFWDYKKPNFISYILLPLTFFVLVGNFFTKKFSKKKNNKNFIDGEYEDIDENK